MELNTYSSQLPPEKIEIYKRYLEKAEPYTQEEFNELELDREYDPDRMNATTANIILNGVEY